LRPLVLLFALLVAGAPGVASAEAALASWLDSTTFDGGGERGEGAFSDAWWEAFDDDALTTLVSAAVEGNHDVAISASRRDAAEARADSVRAGLMPTLTFDVSASGSPSSAQGFQFGGMPTMPGAEEPPDVVYSGSALFNLRYQVDLWGQQTLAHRSARRSVDASESDVDATAANLSVQVGGAYFDAVAAAEQIQIIEAQIELNESLLEVAELRYRQGGSSASDVLQQRQQLAGARARLPGARGTLRTARQRLAVLTGRRPGDEVTVSYAEALPDLPPAPATGAPRDLLEHRPDLRAGRHRVRAAREQRRSSERAALPALGLSAQGGGQAYLSEEYSRIGYWSVGVDLSLPLFRGLSEAASRREARASEREAEHVLEGAVLQAITDVESAVASEQEGTEQLEADHEQLEAARLAYESARDSYVSGVGTYLATLTALVTYQSSQITVLQSHRSLLGARLELHGALGGPWTERLGARAPGGDR